MRVTVLVGVAGSGKSTYVRKRVKKLAGKVSVYSSDEYRKKYFGSLKEGNKNNSEVFNKLIEDMLEEVKEGSTNHIIYDATNLTRRRRRALYTRIKEVSPSVQVYIVYFSLPLKVIMGQNAKRSGEARVPDKVIKEMYISQGVPRKGVDCDYVEIVGIPIFKDKVDKCDTVEDILAKVNTEWKEELVKVQTPHDTKWHLESVDEHINMAISNARRKNKEEDIVTIAKFHDMGKGVTKELHEEGHARYLGHANVSASYYFNYVNFTSDEHNSMNILEAIYQHMNFHQGLGKKNIRNNKLNDTLINKINTFGEIDTISRITKIR